MFFNRSILSFLRGHIQVQETPVKKTMAEKRGGLNKGRCGWGAVFAAALWVVAGSAGCGKSEPPATRDPAWTVAAKDFCGVRAMDELKRFVALGERVSGGGGAARAADYLSARLREFGYDVLTDAFQDETPHGPAPFRNIIARRGGGAPGGTHDPMVILAAHYDTKAGIPGFIGANDSGSGTAVLLEIARVLSRSPAPARGEIMVAFLDGEECRVAYAARDGLHGSKRLAAQLVKNGDAPRVRGVLVLDMVGDRDLSLMLPESSSPAVVRAVLDAARDEGVRECFQYGPGDILDDHASFISEGIPAADLIDFRYGSAPGLNDLWHTPLDTPDKLSPHSLEITGRVTLRAIRHLLAP